MYYLFTIFIIALSVKKIRISRLTMSSVMNRYVQLQVSSFNLIANCTVQVYRLFTILLLSLSCGIKKKKNSCLFMSSMVNRHVQLQVSDFYLIANCTVYVYFLFTVFCCHCLN